MSTPARRLLRAFGPAIPAGHLAEALRAALGAMAALAVLGALVHFGGVDLRLGLYLIAPFGASSVLLFAVPNSPLAQPWSAVVGNGSAAVMGVLACLLVDDPTLRVALAVGAAIAAMILLRAVHPPAGAVAMTAALNPDQMAEQGLWFAVSPVMLGTALLVGLAMAYAPLTARRYPFRQFDKPGDLGADDPVPAERLGLTEAELQDILDRYRQSLNLGVEDLARLIGAAELQAASHRTGPATAGEIMSRNLVTVGPDAPLSEVADLFRRHGFTSIPVVQEGDKFLGVIFQLHLIRRAHEDAFRLERGFGPAMARMLDPRRSTPVRAGEVMSVAMPRVTPETPVAALLPMMAEGSCDAVPVLARGRIVGIVTRTDLIAALARQSLRATD